MAGNATIDFGIDLGTTNSSVACCRQGVVKLFQTTEMMTVTPSVVYIGKSGRMLVGKRAYDAWPGDPENTQAEFKRWMGFSDKLLFPASNREMTAEELSAEVLKTLRGDVQRATGEIVNSAVITVPAAFGVLQCEATGRAAKMAGFAEAPLLQEPIAAAIAYGASGGGKSQRWVVFDLGGGTLDIAVVSTRNGRLAVLEHQGNNRLGGKDIDRAIAEKLLLPPLAERFKLPDRAGQPARYDRLFRSLVRIAEHAKIELSMAATAPVDVFNIGEDLAGTPIELSFSLTREALDKEMNPLLDKCLDLVRRALEGARLGAADIDRVILVGGPTQMPVVRAALVSMLGDKLDYSIDPMTVVAQGAALYASTIEPTVIPPAPAAAAAPAETAAKRGVVALKLNHERASGTSKSPVAGSVPKNSGLYEIKIDADSGVWTSGWIALAQERFMTEVMLAPGKPVTRFTITGRNSGGNAVVVEPAEFSIAYMLPMSAPPLPHTIAVELSSENGSDKFDPIFKRHTPLPAEATRSYRADRTLRPSEMESTLPIKFWEIEVSEDPQEKWWAGCVHIQGAKLKRPITEGTEMSLTIKIDKSRKLSVEVFVPLLNQTFTHEVYVPDPPTTRSQLQQQLDLCFERMARVMQMIYGADREDLRERAEMIQFKLESVAVAMQAEKSRNAAGGDPDAMLEPTDALRKLRVAITQLEEQLETDRGVTPLVLKIRANLRWTMSLAHHGTELDRETVQKLCQQFERYASSGDVRGQNFVDDQARQIRGNIVANLPWFFENQIDYFQRPGQRFSNKQEAANWLAKAQQARERHDLPGMREAVGQLWALQPPDQVEQAQEQAMRSGLRD